MPNQLSDMANKQKAATCIYCGRGSVTKEHIISDWISREWDNGKREFYIRPWKRDPDNPTQYIFAPLEIKKQQRLGQMVLRRVCEPCNSIWMKAIVDNSIDIIKALVNQTEFNLTIEDKKRIASWVVLSCIHYDYLLSYKREKNLRSIHQNDLDFIYDNHYPSYNFEVWISRSEDPEFSQNIWGLPYCLRPVGSKDEVFNAFDFALSIRQVVFFVRYSSVDIPKINHFEPIEHKFLKVWPAPQQDTVYPNQYLMDQQETNTLFNLMHYEANGPIPVGNSNRDIIKIFGF